LGNVRKSFRRARRLEWRRVFIRKAIRELGLTLNGNGCLLLGASRFFALLCGLAIATILGVLTENFRNVQSLPLPNNDKV
jgi:hypothetical protein